MTSLSTLLRSWRRRPLPPNDAAQAKADGNLLADINTVAQAWYGQSWFGAAGSLPFGVATPEELAVAAEDQGLKVWYAQRNLSSLGEGDFPCVILNQAGGSTILTARPAPDRFLILADGVQSEAALADLAGGHGGAVFFIAPQSPAPQEAGREPTSPAGLLRTVATEMATRHRGRLAVLCVAAALANVFLLSVPIFSMAVYDRVIPHLAMETLWALAIGVGVALALDLAVRVVRMKLSDAVGLSVTTAVQAKLFSRILRARLGAVGAAGGAVQTSMREVEALAQLLPNLVASVAIDLPFFVASSLLLYGIAGPVAWIPIAGVALIALIQIVGEVRGRQATEAARLNAAQANLLLESVAGVETVKIANATRPLIRRWERLVDGAAYVGHANRMHGAFSLQAASAIAQAAAVIGMVLGVYQIGDGAMTIGALSATSMLIGRVMAPVTQLGAHLHRLMQILRSARTVEAILAADMEEAGDRTAARRPIQGRLAFQGVGFTYPGETSPALTGVDLVIAPGERVGLIGRAGSGKSTLLKIAMRLHAATQGALLLDGHDIRQVAPERVRGHFGFMRQDSAPFDDTLRNAICFGLESVTEDAFERAVALAGVQEFAARHPAGYGLRVGARGERLSGGERQSVMLARTLLGDPRALVLDEPTAAMDNTMEASIVRELDKALGDRTLIIATHRAPLLALVDRLVWIERGRVVADGPKADILRKVSGQNAA
jgi:ATP-binding cassette, subfamily C, bacterial LapB